MNGKRYSTTRVVSALLSILMLVTLLAPQFVFAKDIVLPDGAFAKWAIDPATEKGGEINEPTADGQWRHFESTTANGNAADPTQMPPAVFVLKDYDNPDADYVMPDQGFFEATVKPLNEHCRFGFYLFYTDVGNSMFVGYDASGWFWQRYAGNNGPYLAGSSTDGYRRAGPAVGAVQNVRFEWNTVDGVRYLTKALLDGEDMFPSAHTTIPMSLEDIGGTGTRVAIKAGAFASRDEYTSIDINNVHYTGQPEIEVYSVSGTVTDDENAPVAGATVTLDDKTATTAADGSYIIENAFQAGEYTLTVSADRMVDKTVPVTVTDDDVTGADVQLAYTDWAFGPGDGALGNWLEAEESASVGTSINTMTEDGWRHFRSSADHGNNSDATKSPAVFYLDGYEMPEEGFFQATMKLGDSGESKLNTWGFYMNYTDRRNTAMLGLNGTGWFWQLYMTGAADTYGNYKRTTTDNVDYGTEKVFRVEWSTVGGKLQADSITIAGEELLTGPLELAPAGVTDGKGIGFKASTWNENTTEFFIKDVTYTDQPTSRDVPAYQIAGRVVDTLGRPLEGAEVTAGGLSAVTGADGLFALQGLVAGAYTVEVSLEDYRLSRTDVTIDAASVAMGDVAIRPVDDGMIELESDAMTVRADPEFPRVVDYTMKASGTVVQGQPTILDTIRINGVNIVPEVTSVAAADGKSVTYTMHVKSGTAIDGVLTAVMAVEDNTLTFDITKVENNLDEWNNTISTIEIPNHSLVSIRGTDTNPTFAGAVMSTHTSLPGDTFTTLAQMSGGAYNYAIISNSKASASLWSNSETGGSSTNPRVTVDVAGSGSTKTAGLRSSYWYYQRKIKGERAQADAGTNPQDANGYYLVPPVEMPHAAVVVTDQDVNSDGTMDWQDGAIEFRKIMNELQGGETTPELVAYRIAMNFGGHAQNPFLMTLDNVKRIAMHTDGLGQAILLKGYGNEGHDSGHPDYGDIGQRIGGADEMNYLMEKGADYGARFGVHINAGEMYPEAKAFDDDLVRRTGPTSTSPLRYGWNWIDQGIGLDSRFDHGSGRRLSRLESLKAQVGDNMDFIYLDIWGNGTGSAEDGWDTRQVVNEINDQGWRFSTEFGGIAEGYAVFQHWAMDLSYGGIKNKGHNSHIMRFIRNQERDTWPAETTDLQGACVAPLLGGENMKDFEGWQGRSDYDEYVKNLFAFNIVTKFLQHYEATEWERGTYQTFTYTDDGKAVTGNITPDLRIVLKDDVYADDADVVEVTRKSGIYSESLTSDYRDRTVTLNGKVIVTGRMAKHNASAVQTQTERYLVPWYWDNEGNPLPDDEKKLYHFNQDAANLTSVWELPDDWAHLDSVKMYELTDLGRTNMVEVPVVNGKVTLTAKQNTPYVVYQGEAGTLSDVIWSDGMHVWDAGFNSGKLDHWTKTGAGTVELRKSDKSNWMLVETGAVEMSQPITGLEPGKSYVAYVGVDNRSDSKATIRVMNGDELVGEQYTLRSIARNYVKADAHSNNNPTLSGGGSYFQNMFVFFTAPEEVTGLRLVLAREAGSGDTYWDNIRITPSDAVGENGTTKQLLTKADGSTLVKVYEQDFERNAAGLYPFVVAGSEGCEDNRIHLSELHAPYTQAGWDVKKMNDVLDGNWSLKVNGLVQKNYLIYQTIPQHLRFEPGQTYRVSFDYQMGSEDIYQVAIGNSPYGGATSGISQLLDLEKAMGGNEATKTMSFEVTGAANGQTWFGIYSTSKAPDYQGITSGDQQSFGGYKEIVVDNVRAELISEVDWTDLFAAIEAADALNGSDYDPAEWQALAALVSDAEALVQAGSAGQAEVDEAVAGLLYAMAALGNEKGTLTGVVTGAGGAAVADATVELHTEGLPTRYAATGADGGYSLGTIVGRDYVVKVAANGYTPVYRYTFTAGNAGEVKDFALAVKAAPDYANNFDGGIADIAGYGAGNVTLAAKGGALVASFAANTNSKVVYDQNSPQFRNGAIEADITVAEGDVGNMRMGLVVRGQQLGQYIFASKPDGGNLDNYFWQFNNNGQEDWSPTHFSGPEIVAGETYHFKAEIVDNLFTLWVDDVKVFSEVISDASLPDTAGYAGIYGRNGGSLRIDNLEIYNYDPPVAGKANLAGVVTETSRSQATLPVAGAKVELLAGLIVVGQTITAPDGSYRLRDIAEGGYTLRITKDGYRTLNPALYLEGEETADQTLVYVANLAAEIAASEGLIEADYTATSWGVFANALSDARKALSMDVNQAAVYATGDTLKARREALVPAGGSEVDTFMLRALINRMEALTEGEYRSSVWSDSRTPLAEAKALLAGSGYTQAQVNAAYAALSTAWNNLMDARVTRATLNAYIAAAQERLAGSDIGEYKAADVATLRSLLEAALAARDNADATQDAIDLAANNLYRHYVAMVKEEEEGVNKAGLAATIAQAEALDLGLYTEATAAAVTSARAEAKTVFEDAEANQAQVDAAKSALDAAIAALELKDPAPADKTALNATIAEAGVLDLDLYTEATASAVADALDAAKAVAGDNDATQAQVDAAKSALDAAIAALELKDPAQADKTALNAAIAEAEALDLDLYTEATASAVADALNAAKAVAGDNDATQAQVDAAKSALDAAIAALELKDPAQADKTALNAAIAEAEALDLSLYTDATAAAVTAALAEAKAVAGQGGATQAQVDAATKALADAIEALERKDNVDLAALKSLYNSVKDLTNDRYLAVTWARFDTARTAAKALIDAVEGGGTATQQEIWDAYDELAAARGALELWGDASALEFFVDLYSTLEQSKYTQATWTVFAAAMQEAHDVLAMAPETRSQAVINAVGYKLILARNKLADRLDTSGLEQAIVVAELLLQNESDYMPTMVAKLKTAVQAAKDVLALPEEQLTSAKVGEALQNLVTAMSELFTRADRDQLGRLIHYVAMLNEEHYTAASWANLNTVKAAAQAVYDDLNALQEEIEDAYTRLSSAVSALKVRANKQGLEVAVAVAQSITGNIGAYVPSTVQGLQEVLDRALAMLANDDAIQSQVDAMTTELMNKVVAARKTANKNLLKSALGTAGRMSQQAFSQASAEAYERALAAAQTVLNDENADQNAVNAALATLNNAVAALVPAGSDKPAPAPQAAPEATVAPAVEAAAAVTGTPIPQETPAAQPEAQPAQPVAEEANAPAETEPTPEQAAPEVVQPTSNGSALWWILPAGLGLLLAALLLLALGKKKRKDQ